VSFTQLEHTFTPLKFELEKTDPASRARAGKITTDHGEIQTPIFMPVGTVASVKGVHQRELEDDINAQIILGNTYHLYLKPGIDILEQAGGLHQFMNWNGPILTDSGGYQVYSLSNNRKITEEGVNFQSHSDGSRHFFTPELAIDIQKSIGGDIIMAFDECTPYPCDLKYATDSMHMTHRWLKRCCEHMDKTQGKYGYEQALFPIVQGSVYPELRKQSAEAIASADRFGNAIGGLSVGEENNLMYDITGHTAPLLPANKPRYLMGVGTPEDLLKCSSMGVDMFDCVMPTRHARTGSLFVKAGKINIKNSQFKTDPDPIDPDCSCYTCLNYSKAYLRHLIMAGEILAMHLLTVHNSTFYQQWMVSIRKAIADDTPFNMEWSDC